MTELSREDPTKRRRHGLICVLLLALGGCGGSLNQTSITCSADRTLLDGVCVSEQVADYVACVRARGAELGAEKQQRIAVDARSLGVKAGGASELSESLQKKYSASDAAMLAIIEACNGAVGAQSVASASGRRFHYFYAGDASQRRDWSQDGIRWIERSPEGITTAFVTVGRVTVAGQPGLELRRDPDDGDRLFVPDAGASDARLRYKSKDSGSWSSLGPIMDD